MEKYIKLNNSNIDKFIKNYLSSVRSIRLLPQDKDILKYIHSVKRYPLKSGPYKVSLFEACNRILSDITILLGIKHLLTKQSIGSVRLPFSEYHVVLGVDAGDDVRAGNSDAQLYGEAFNVAMSFFQQKKRSSIKKLNKKKAQYRILIFNEDAVINASYYFKKSTNKMAYLPVNIWNDLKYYT